MSRRKSNVTKRSEYVDHSSDEETTMKVQSRKRKLEIDTESIGSEDSDWETLQSSPKMVKVNRQKPQRSSASRSVVDHAYEKIEVDSKKHCTNRNALMARQNRMKKKMYVETLENTIQELKKNYEAMQKQINEQNEVIARVTKENKYLRNVITNSSGLKQILQGVRLAGLANSRPNQSVHSTSSLPIKTEDPNLNHQKGTDPFLNYSDLFSDLDIGNFTDSLSLPVCVTEDSHPTSTTCDATSALDDLKWDMLNGAKPNVPVHDYSSNPQLYYDTVPAPRRWQNRDDLQI